MVYLRLLLVQRFVGFKVAVLRVYMLPGQVVSDEQGLPLSQGRVATQDLMNFMDN